MRNCISFVIAIFVGCIATFAQDLHQPPPMTFSQPQLIHRAGAEKFLYSWNWINGPRALNQRYRNNAYHTMETFNNGWSLPRNNDLQQLLMPDSTEFIWKPWKVHANFEPLHAHASMWLPWLPAVTDNTFTAYRNDKSGASLSFLVRDTTIGSLDSTVGSEVIYRWRLNRDTSIDTLIPAFSDPWLGNEFLYRNKAEGTDPNPPFTNFDFYNTRRMYLSINLRRLGTDTVMNDDTVLVLKLPYTTYGGSSGFMSFDSVPNPAVLTTQTRGQIRPVVWSSASDLTTFVITRRMLPPTDSANPDML